MASAHNSSEYVQDLSDLYGESVEAVEQEFPGIFRPENKKHEVLGEVDLLVREDGESDIYRALEVKTSESLRQKNIIRQAEEARDQCNTIEDYFEGLREDIELEAEYLIKPEGNLEEVYRLWNNLPEEFCRDDAADVVDDAGRMPYIEDEALVEVDEEIYRVDDSLSAVFESGIVQP